MKNRRAVALICLIVVTAMLFAGCGASGGNEYGSKLVGKWANTYEKDTPSLIFTRNGKATYDGVEYTFSADENYITLTSADGSTQTMRYTLDGKDLTIYKVTEYICEDHDGLVGLWENKDLKWSFEFSKSGTFKEDGYFPGYYVVDEPSGTFKLIYNDKFVDTTCYYVLDGNTLTVEYPWPMVKSK